MDEPTTGLHTADIHKLKKVLNQLVEGGNIVTTGTPEEVAKVKGSYTGQFLKGVL